MLKDVLLITHSYYANGFYHKDHSCEVASTIEQANQAIDKILNQYCDSPIRAHVSPAYLAYLNDSRLNEIENDQIAMIEYYSIYGDMGYIRIGYPDAFYQSIKNEHMKKMNQELSTYQSVVKRYKKSKRILKAIYILAISVYNKFINTKDECWFS